MISLGSLTVLDWLGIRHTQVAGDEYSLLCPSCNSRMTTTPWYSECSDPTCELRVVGPLDMLAWALHWKYGAAAKLANEKLIREVITKHQVTQQHHRHNVMSTWLKLCHSPAKLSSAMFHHNVLGLGGELSPGQESMCILTEDETAMLVRLACVTGATNQGDLRHDCAATLATVTQSVPWHIDKILLSQPNSKATLTWSRRNGFGGLIGLAGSSGRKFSASPTDATVMQRTLRVLGNGEEIGYWRNESEITVPCRFQSRKIMMLVDSVEQMISGAKVLRSFGIERYVRACESKDFSGLSAAAVKPVRWPAARQGQLLKGVGKASSLTAEAVRLIEAAAPPREEIASMSEFFRTQGKLTLAEEILAHLDNRVISSDGSRTVRETASTYTLETLINKATIANFTIRFSHNVLFSDQSDLFHAGTMICGRDSIPVVLKGDALGSPKSLEGALQSQFAARNKKDAMLPVVSDPATFRNHVLPYLKTCTASLGAADGVSALGWSMDRQRYHLPGLMIDMDGRRPGASFFHPHQPALKMFEPELVWPDVCTSEFPKAARDLISMILAQAARYYLRLQMKPLCVNNASGSRSLALALAKALGQKDVYEVNSNVRDTSPTPGVRGYPLLAHGHSYQQAQTSSAAIVLLTDGGYSGTDEDTFGTLETIGRTMQHSLLRVIEWLLETAGEGYVEVPSHDYNYSLLKEGSWLAETVCRMQPWELVDSHDALDAWLGRHGYEKLCAQMRLTADMRLIIPESMRAPGLENELRLVDDTVEDDGELRGSAVTLLPAFSRYFGKELLVALAED